MVDKTSRSKQEISPSPSPSPRDFTRSSSISRESPPLREMPLDSSDHQSSLVSGAVATAKRHWWSRKDLTRSSSEITQPNNKQEELKARADKLVMDTYGKKGVTVYRLGTVDCVSESPEAFAQDANSHGYTITDLGALKSGSDTQATHTDKNGIERKFDVKNVEMQHRVEILEKRKNREIKAINEHESKLSGRQFKEIYRCQDRNGRVYMAGSPEELVGILKEQGLTITEDELGKLKEEGNTCNATGDDGTNVELSFISLEKTRIEKKREVESLKKMQENACELAMDTYGEKDVTVYRLGTSDYVNDSPEDFEQEVESKGYTIADLEALKSGRNTQATYTDTSGTKRTIDVKNVEMLDKVDILKRRKDREIAAINEHESELSGRQFNEIYRCQDGDGRVHIAGNLKELVGVLKGQGLTITEEELGNLKKEGDTCNATRNDDNSTNVELSFISLEKTRIEKKREVESLKKMQENADKLAMDTYGKKDVTVYLLGTSPWINDSPEDFEQEVESKGYTIADLEALKSGSDTQATHTDGRTLEVRNVELQRRVEILADRKKRAIEDINTYESEVSGRQFNEIYRCEDRRSGRVYIAGSLKDLVGVLKRQGLTTTEEGLGNLKKEGDMCNATRGDDNSANVELKFISLEKTRIKKKREVESLKWSIGEIQENTYNRRDKPVRTGFILEVEDKQLRKDLGMESSREFFTADELRRARLYSRPKQYNEEIAKMGAGDVYSLDLPGKKKVRVIITRTGLERTEQELKKRQTEIKESIEQLTNKKFTNIPRAFRVVETVSKENVHIENLESDMLVVTADLGKTQNTFAVNYSVNSDIDLRNIGIGEEITFTDTNGCYVKYERIALKDAKETLEGKLLYKKVKHRLNEYYDILKDQTSKELENPSNFLNPQKREKKKAQEILVGIDDIKDIDNWKTVYAASVGDEVDEEGNIGKLMFAKDKKSMRDAFPGTRIKPLSQEEARKRLRKRIEDEQAPQQIREKRNGILFHAAKKELEKNPQQKQLAAQWDAMQAAGDIEVALQQDNSEQHCCEIDHHDISGNVVATTRFMSTSLYQIAKYSGASYSAIEKASNELSRYEKAKARFKARFNDIVVPDKLQDKLQDKSWTKTVRMIPINCRRAQQIIMDASEILMVGEPDQKWHIFEGTEMGKKKWYISDNEKYEKLGVENMKMIASGMDLNEFPDGVERAEYISDADWWDKGVHGIGRSWDAVKHSPITVPEYGWKKGKGLFTLIMEIGNKDDSKGKKRPLEDSEEDSEEPKKKAKVEEDDTTSSFDGGYQWNVNNDRSLFDGNHSEISAF